jgi:transcriptional regulator with PAS, ATPase and Fis domain
MNAALAKARQAARTDSIILLLGRSGSGKDHMARFIHSQSLRSDGPFFDVNCAVVPPDLAESELFGHEAGAFTGATRRKRGLVELAEGGTLLLNEIGELSLPLQAKLLAFLDTRTFSRVGGEKRVTVNARLIFATNRDLEEEVESGGFRQDLFYRINVLSIEVPPLRERIEDLPILVRETLARLAANMNLPHAPVIEPAAVEILTQYDWPGNVRELCNVLERAVIVRKDGMIRASDIGLKKKTGDWSFTVTFPSDQTLNDLTRDMKRAVITEALRLSEGRRKEAAEMLGISRNSLLHYMKTLDIEG